MSQSKLYSHSKASNFSIVSNSIINNYDLKLEDRALLIWMLSKPQGWSFSIRSMATLHHVSKDKINGITKRLAEKNLLFIQRANSGNCIWHIFESTEDCQQLKESLKGCKSTNTPNPENQDKPHPENQDRGLKTPHPEKPDPENQDVLVSTDPLVRTKKDIFSKFDFSKWPNLPSEQVLKDWFAHRKNKKLTTTQTVVDKMATELTKAVEAGYTIDNCLSEVCERGWTGFKLEWVQGSGFGNNNAKNGADVSVQKQQTKEWLKKYEKPNG